MKPWERYAAAEPAPTPDDGPWSKYAPPSFTDQALGVARDVAAGAVRGAGSIGATLLAPLDAAARAVGVENSVIGRTDRREAMDAALADLTGANPDSTAYTVGKLGAEVAGTLGVGGALAKGLQAVPGVATVAAPLIDAVRTAGMTAGGMTGPAGLAVRSAGAALTGGAAAGLVDPGTAGEGALIGAAMPPAAAVAGKVGKAIGNTIRGPMQTPEVAAAVKAARDAGYVIPPTQARPSLGNRAIEGFAGKITTAQNASARNQVVTNNLAAKALGLPKGTPITPDLLQSVRQSAGQAYDAVASSGTIVPGQAYSDALDKIAAPALKAAQGFPNAKPSPVLAMVDELRSPSFDAGSAVEKIKELRSAADDAFRSGSTDIGRAARAAAKALEDALEAHLSASGQQSLLKGFRDARTLIAKTYTVEKALNPASGTVDARKLARELAKGKPLSGELRAAAEFGAQFPKAAQAVEGMGSLPQLSPLDFFGAASLSALSQNPLGMVGLAARPAARATALSPIVQNRLIQANPTLLNALPLGQAAQLGYRAAPVIGPSAP